MSPNGAVCRGPVLRPSGCSQPHGNGSHSRPNPRRETIEEAIGIYSSRSTRSDIERGGKGASRSRAISRTWRYDLARSRAISSETPPAGHTIDTFCLRGCGLARGTTSRPRHRVPASFAADLQPGSRPPAAPPRAAAPDPTHGGRLEVLCRTPRDGRPSPSASSSPSRRCSSWPMTYATSWRPLRVGTRTERRGQDGPPAYATLTRRTTYSPAAERTKRVSEGRPCSQGESTQQGSHGSCDIGSEGRLGRGAQGGREGPRHRAHGVGVSLCIRPDGGTSPPERRARTGENFGVFKAPHAN